MRHQLIDAGHLAGNSTLNNSVDMMGNSESLNTHSSGNRSAKGNALIRDMDFGGVAGFSDFKEESDSSDDAQSIATHDENSEQRRIQPPLEKQEDMNDEGSNLTSSPGKRAVKALKHWIRLL